MIHASTYITVKGFNPLLLNDEEAELYSRIPNAQFKIVRIDSRMVIHDSGLNHLNDWWKKAVQGGSGDALEYEILSDSFSQERKNETQSIIVCLIVPVLALFGLADTFWNNWTLLTILICICGYLSL